MNSKQPGINSGLDSPMVLMVVSIDKLYRDIIIIDLRY
jgi:hypothetical protein